MRLQQCLSDAAVAACHDGFQTAEVGFVIAIVDAFCVQVCLQQMDAPQIFLRRDLRCPLKRREGLRDKIRRRQIDRQPALFPAAVLPPDLKDFIDQLRNANYILIRFRRQTQHEIQLHTVPAAGKGRGAGGENFFFCYVFIDRVAQALRSSLRCERQAAFAHLLDAHHELPRKIIRAQARQREIDLARLTVVEQTVGQGFQLAVIGGRKAGQRDLTVAGIFEGFDCLFT